MPPSKLVDDLARGVYVAQEVGTTYIKIGQSESVYQRIAELQTGNPRELKLIAILPGGDNQYELQEHARFQDFRVRHNGEWFVLSPPIALILFREYSIIEWTPEFMAALYSHPVYYRAESDEEFELRMRGWR